MIQPITVDVVIYIIHHSDAELHPSISSPAHPAESQRMTSSLETVKETLLVDKYLLSQGIYHHTDRPECTWMCVCVYHRNISMVSIYVKLYLCYQ